MDEEQDGGVPDKGVRDDNEVKGSSKVVQDAPTVSQSHENNKKKRKNKNKGKNKKNKRPPSPPPSQDNVEKNQPSRIGEFELRFGCEEIVLAAGDLDASVVTERFLVGRLKQDVSFGVQDYSTASIEWFDLVKDDLFKTRGKSNLEELPIKALVCSITKHCEESSIRGKDTLKIKTGAWAYAERKLLEQLKDDYRSDEDSQFGDEAVSKRVLCIRRKISKLKG